MTTLAEFVERPWQFGGSKLPKNPVSVTKAPETPKKGGSILVSIDEREEDSRSYNYLPSFQF